MNEFIIVFRESLEASLIVGIIYALLERNGLKKQLRQLWLGVLFALVASVVVGLMLKTAKQSIGNASIEALFESISMLLTAVLLWYVIFWLSRQTHQISALENQTRKAMDAAGWGVFLVVFFAILREGFETAIFLMGSFSMLDSFSYMGFAGGLLCAITIGYMVVRQGRRVNLHSFFTTTSLLLAVFASGMIAYGTHEAEEFLVKGDHLHWLGLETKHEITRPWDILKPREQLDETDNPSYYSYNINGKQQYTHLLHDKGRIGLFLKGFFGYNSNPNWVELVLWITSLMFGIGLWKRLYLTARTS